MTDDWSFGGQWPHEPRFFDTPDGRLHYVDEGPRDGRPVVLLHGNPTWGFLYRHFVAPLVESGHRVVVPDHLGFGRSEKPGDAKVYAIPRHAQRLDALLESLDLHGAVLVPQDWGGPIGLAWAVAHPERVDGLFILNTFAHRPRERTSLPLPLRVFRLPGVGEVLVKGLLAFHRGLLFGVGTTTDLPDAVKEAYLAPHPTWSSRTATLAFPRAIPSGPDGEVPDFLAGVEAGMIEHFRDKPVALTWAMKDPAFASMLDSPWRQTFPDADVARLPDAGHYLQEDAPQPIVERLLAFSARLG